MYEQTGEGAFDMVNVGLKPYLWHRKAQGEISYREIWRLNEATYSAYRRYTERVKDEHAALVASNTSCPPSLGYATQGSQDRTVCKSGSAKCPSMVASV